MTSTATKATLVVTKDELLELAEWERKFADAKKKVSAAEKELAVRRIALAEKVLGVNSADELKALSPEQVARKFSRRLENGDWKPASGAPEFQFVKTSEGRYPSWAKLYVEELGESEANRIKADTSPTYSYAVEVSVPA